MRLSEEIKHFDNVVEDIMGCMAECTTVQRAVVAKALRVRYSGDDDILDAIRELISSPDFPARRLAELASRLTLPKYRYQGDRLFSVLQVNGPDSKELLATGDIDAATRSFLEITNGTPTGSAKISEEQAREIVTALIPGRIIRP